jgi:hypothetical protein
MNYRRGRPQGSMRSTLERGDPRKFSSNGLACFLNAERGITIDTGVGVWAGVGGSGASASNATDATQPTLSATGGPGGKPAVAFTGGQLLQFADVFSAFTAAELFMVWKADADPSVTGAGGLWYFGTGGSADVIPFTDGNVYDGFGSSARKDAIAANPTVSLATWNRYSVVTTSAEWTSRINGTQHSTTATNTVAFHTSCNLGVSNNPGAVFFEGKVHEFVLFSSKLGASERGRVESRQKAICGA